MPSTFGEPCTPNGAVANQQQSDRPRCHAELCVLVEALTRFGAVHSSRHGAQLKWEDMTKAEFIETLAQNLGQTRSESERVLESVVEVLRQALQRSTITKQESSGAHAKCWMNWSAKTASAS